jgi:hypothetical protein
MTRPPIRTPQHLAPPLRPCRLGRRWRAALGAAAFALALGSACADDPVTPELGADAGLGCERGTRNCACIGGSRCQDELLCIAGRCSLMLEPAPDTTPRPRPTLPGPAVPARDAGGSAPPGDAGSPDASAPDASASGEEGAGTPPSDAGTASD